MTHGLSYAQQVLGGPTANGKHVAISRADSAYMGLDVELLFPGGGTDWKGVGGVEVSWHRPDFPAPPGLKGEGLQETGIIPLGSRKLELFPLGARRPSGRLDGRYWTLVPFVLRSRGAGPSCHTHTHTHIHTCYYLVREEVVRLSITRVAETCLGRGPEGGGGRGQRQLRSSDLPFVSKECHPWSTVEWSSGIVITMVSMDGSMHGGFYGSTRQGFGKGFGKGRGKESNARGGRRKGGGESLCSACWPSCFRPRKCFPHDFSVKTRKEKGGKGVVGTHCWWHHDELAKGNKGRGAGSVHTDNRRGRAQTTIISAPLAFVRLFA